MSPSGLDVQGVDGHWRQQPSSAKLVKEVFSPCRCQMNMSLLYCAHLSAALATDAPTHSRWLKGRCGVVRAPTERVFEPRNNNKKHVLLSVCVCVRVRSVAGTPLVAHHRFTDLTWEGSDMFQKLCVKVTQPSRPTVYLHWFLCCWASWRQHRRDPLILHVCASLWVSVVVHEEGYR